jgi:uncharacterized membrane protein
LATKTVALYPTPKTVGSSPPWEILISHHLPHRLGRTLALPLGQRTIHLCARCTGQVLGLLTILLIFLVGRPLIPSLLTPQVQLLFALAPLVAAVDWLTQSLGWRESNNTLRLLSGVLLGMALTDVLILLLSGNWLLFGTAMLVAALYIAVLAIVLKITGAWRRVLEEHFPGVEIGSSGY